MIGAPKKNRVLLYLLPVLVGFFFLLVKFFFFSSSENPKPLKPPESPPLSRGKVFSGRISKGQTLSTALRSLDLSPPLVDKICSSLQPLLNLRRIKPGDSFEVHLNAEGKFLRFSYRASPIEIYALSLTPQGEWVAEKKEVPVESYWQRISGEVNRSLFEAIDALGEQDPLILDFADIFAWEIDFHSDARPGDRFQMVVEKYYTGETFVKYGRILYALYQSGSRSSEALYFKPTRGRGDYFTPQGHSLRKALLRSPLQFTRVSSGYTQSRRHPILNRNAPHLGIDYAAPKGSPVWAVADGTVSFCGWNGGFGKQIIIKHAGGYQSMYGHLSRFAPEMKKGKVAQQKQIIGYVGSTGLSTGPHLDYRLAKNGVFRNPVREVSPQAGSLQGPQWVEFQSATHPVLAWLRDRGNPQFEKRASLNSTILQDSKP